MAEICDPQRERAGDALACGKVSQNVKSPSLSHITPSPSVYVDKKKKNHEYTLVRGSISSAGSSPTAARSFVRRPRFVLLRGN